jgi:probable addiction module antidote protein
MSDKPSASELHFTSDLDDIVRHINGAFETADVDLMCRAIGEASRIYNISDVAKLAGVARQSVYRAFSGAQHPNLDTVVTVLGAMGLKLCVKTRRGTRFGKVARRSSG